MWFVVKIKSCRENEAEALSEIFENFGAASVTLTDEEDNPVLEPLPGTTPLWPTVVVTALFSEQEDAQQSAHALLNQHPTLEIEHSMLEDEDWERAWMVHYEPLKFGRLWVVPSWMSPPDPQAINLILDPGLAFGTGTHPTTALCLDWLGHADLINKSVIDYGCGSGILAIAACKLGASHVDAVDIDEQAITATHQNAQTNEINHDKLRAGLINTFPLKAQILIANILLEPLMQLKEQFAQALEKDGVLVVSGLLSQQACLLIDAYQGLFKLKSQQDKDGWSLLTFEPL